MIAGDEARHEAFYTRMMGKVFDRDPAGGMLAFRSMLRGIIAMPGTVHGGRHAIRICSITSRRCPARQGLHRARLRGHRRPPGQTWNIAGRSVVATRPGRKTSCAAWPNATYGWWIARPPPWRSSRPEPSVGFATERHEPAFSAMIASDDWSYLAIRREEGSRRRVRKTLRRGWRLDGVEPADAVLSWQLVSERPEWAGALPVDRVLERNARLRAAPDITLHDA